MVEHMFLIKILMITAVFWATLAFAVSGDKHYKPKTTTPPQMNSTKG